MFPGAWDKVERLTRVVFNASIAEIMIIQKQQAVALDISILRRPWRSMKKNGLELCQLPSKESHKMVGLTSKKQGNTVSLVRPK